MTWDNNVELLIKEGNETINEYLKSGNIGSKKTAIKIKNKHPGYLHMLYRYVIHTLGQKASFVALCIYMNQRSCIKNELRENLLLTRRMLHE